jgi:hypothetical protein
MAEIDEVAAADVAAGKAGAEAADDRSAAGDPLEGTE